MKNLLIIAILIVPFLNCSTSGIDEEIREVNVRISNSSEFVFENILFMSQGNELRFGNLNPGKSSEFKIIDSASSTAFVELFIEGVIYTIQPIDNLGNGILGPGKYTFKVKAEIKDRYNTLEYEFVEN